MNRENDSTVLIVDDNRENLYLLEQILKDGSNKVVAAGNGVEALEKLKEHSVDIIISDILMPKMDGFQLCRKCKQDEKLNKIPFIFYSAIYTDKKDEEFALSLGAEKFLVKPMDPEKLMGILENTMKEQKKGGLATAGKPIKDESVYLTEYNERLVEKLENKVNALETEVAERMQIEEALHKSEERYRRITDSITDYIYTVRVEAGQPVETKHREACMAITGYTGQEFAADPFLWIRMVVKEEYDLVRQQADDIFSGKIPQPVEYRIIRKDGIVKWVESTVVPNYDMEGSLISYDGIVRDITERKRAEEKIKEEGEISSSLLQIFEILNTTLNEKQLIESVINIVPEYLKFNRMAMFLYNEELNGFTASGSSGFTAEEESVLSSRTYKEGDFPAIDTLMKGKPAVVDNAKEYTQLSKDFVDTLNIGSAILVPIFLSRKVKGILLGEYRKVNSIRTRDISLLKGLADGLGISLQNSRLYRESTERRMKLTSKIETIKAMNQIDREILSAIDKDTVLNTSIAMINRVIPCDRASILLRERNIYKVLSEWGAGVLKTKCFKLTDDQVDIIENSRSPIFVPNLSVDTAQCPYHKSLSDIGMRSSLMLPLVCKEMTIGILDISSTYPARFTPADLLTAESLAAQITIALENANLYEDLQQLLINTITSFASTIDAKSPWTRGHSERVTKYAVAIGKKFGLDDNTIEILRLGGLLHDIGKIGTYDNVLDKPDELSPEEYEHIKNHPVRGAKIIEPIKQLNKIVPILKYHHERMDGKGYPEGLKGEEIPLLARILCVADTYDAINSDRPYRKSPKKDYAVSELRKYSGAHFDPKIVEAFLEVIT